MKQKLLLLLFALLPLVASAQVEIEGIYYNLNSSNQTAEVTSNPNQYTGDVVIPEKVNYNGNDYNVTRIGLRAFQSCSSLTSVTIPKSVTRIRDSAFNGCDDITSVFVSSISDWCKIQFDDIYSNPLQYAKHFFLNGTEIKDLVIPNDVISISSYAFWGCSSLSSVSIPGNVTDIGRGAFWGCTGLLSVKISEGVSNIAESAFTGCTNLYSVAIPKSVTGIGNYAFSGCENLDCVYITDIAAWCQIKFGNSESNPVAFAKHLLIDGYEITDLVIPQGITCIGNYTFYSCENLTSVTIPNSVTSIGTYAFAYCPELTSVTIPNSVTIIAERTFYGCSGLVFMTIPNSVTSIGSSAFYGCSGLTSVTIPESVTSIGSSAFSDCSGLTSVAIPNSVTSIGSYVFDGCSGLTSMTIPESVTSIGSAAFRNCSGLTSVTIPESVTTIGTSAFYGCSGLTSFVIPNGVTTIEDYTFYECNGLTTISIPNSVTSIGNFVFSGCHLLSSIEIPNSVQSIGGSAFSNCRSLTSVTIPENVTSIANSVFYGCRGLTSINIPESVTAIGNSAFSYCSGLTTVTIPNSVTSIGEKAFQNCSKMVTLLLSDNLKMISNSTFSYCWNLTSITIPASVEYIYADAFGNCSALEKVKVLAETPPFLHDKAFSKYDIPLLVPVGCKEAYQSAQGWKNFTTISDSRYTLTYMVDGEEYKSYLIESGTAITPEAEPTKDTYKFSGWSEIPETMPAHDVVVTGTFERYFDVGHLAKVINFVMKSNASTSDVALYDLNADEELNIGDIILIVRNILSHDTNNMAAVGRRAAETIDLTQYTAAQFEVKMADGKDINLVGSMAQTHQLMWKKKAENTYNVVVYSLSNQLMTPENGHIIEMDGVETVGNLIAAKPSGETDCYQSLPVSTGIQQMASENHTAVVFDLKGNRLKSGKALEKGVYIVNGKKTVVR